LFLQKSGNFLEDINDHDVALKLSHGNSQIDRCEKTITLPKSPRTQKAKKYSSVPSSIFPLISTSSSKYDS